MAAPAWLTAIATVVLVLVTISYVWLTNRLAEQAAQSAKAAERAADAAERALLVDAMPLVTVRFGGGSQDRFELSVMNDGTHAAVNVLVSGKWQGVPLPHHPMEIPRIPPNASQAMTMTPDDSRRAMTAYRKDHELSAEWQDPFGNRYRSVTTQDTSSGKPRVSISTYRSHGDEWLPLAG